MTSRTAPFSQNQKQGGVGMLKRALEFEEEAQLRQLERKRVKHKKLVVCFTRRSDGVANEKLFNGFLSALEAGVACWHNPLRTTQVCARSVTPQDVHCISWWSKVCFCVTPGFSQRNGHASGL